MKGMLNTDVLRDEYDALIDFLQEDIRVNDRVSASFHFLRYHDTMDREHDFLEVLRSNLVGYCFSKERYRNANHKELSRLTFEARDKFFNPKDSASNLQRKGRSGASRSGELGEIALYFLLESYLNAPQVISKMALKTTAGENVKGSDGIHVGRFNEKNCVFFCESKLNKKSSKAFSDCIKSVIEFQGTKKRFEISVVNNHIDIENQELRSAIIDFLDPTKAKSEDWVEVHSCFVGFDWNKFGEIEKETDNDELHAKLKTELSQEFAQIKNDLQSQFVSSQSKLRFYFFVMPFKDIESLRKSFLELLYGKSPN